jgi:UTP--glucose-1-phosphate uridylyltransferase
MQMLERHVQEKASVIAVETIAKEDSKKYGIVAVDENCGIRAIVEKPEPEDAPSNLGVVGRYVLTPSIFALLEQTQKGAGGEIQLTDAIASLLAHEKAYALAFDGRRYDCGSKIGYLEATVDFALKHPELSQPFYNLLKHKGLL